MPQKVTVFLFVKGTANSEVERLVADGQLAASLDTLERLTSVSEVGTIVVATANEQFATTARALGAQVDMDSPAEGFHWGHRLAALVDKFDAEVPLYIGGGSGPLMAAGDWRAIAQCALERSETVVTNNYFSCDFAAWSPGNALRRIEMPALDNDLAFRLGERARLTTVPLARNAATQLDIDTPSDLIALAAHPQAGPHLKELLSRAQLDTSRATKMLTIFRDPNATSLIAGRVSASMALFLERETRCQWRVLSEERGMRASGREERGEARSLVGFYLERVGAKGLFATIGRLAGAAVIDSRVLFAHQGWRPTASDRFNSDMLRAELIGHPALRDFAVAARGAGIPILLGGHSLVSGGMYALVESAHPKNLLT